MGHQGNGAVPGGECQVGSYCQPWSPRRTWCSQRPMSCSRGRRGAHWEPWLLTEEGRANRCNETFLITLCSISCLKHSSRTGGHTWDIGETMPSEWLFLRQVDCWHWASSRETRWVALWGEVDLWLPRHKMGVGDHIHS